MRLLLMMSVIFLGCSKSSEPQPVELLLEDPARIVIEKPVPAAPVPAEAKPMDLADATYCCMSATPVILSQLQRDDVRVMVLPNFQQLVLDPRGNQHEATHAILARVAIFQENGTRNVYIWAIYCADDDVVAVENMGLGRIAEP